MVKLMVFCDMFYVILLLLGVEFLESLLLMSIIIMILEIGENIREWVKEDVF